MQMQIEVGQAKVEFQHKGQWEEVVRVKVVQVEAKIIHKVHNHQILVGEAQRHWNKEHMFQGCWAYQVEGFPVEVAEEKTQIPAKDNQLLVEAGVEAFQ